MNTTKFIADGMESGDSEGREEQSADDYLSKLARSVLSREKMGPVVPAQHKPARRAPVPPMPATPPPVRGPISNAHPSRSSESRQAVMPPTPSAFISATPNGLRGAGDWVREVTFYDTSGNVLPGTILLFEDGAVGVFKESNPVKEYDIIYMLRESGRVVPQGMPLFAYDVDPIGRLSAGCFDQLSKNGRWERDMMVFHLLKYKDHVHIPQINEGMDVSTPSPIDRLTTLSVRKLNASEHAAPLEEDKEKPAFVRGRRLTIDFGPQQKWEAVYWGKDELGHVVAHNTHDKWALMHLDLSRFKDSIVIHDFVESAILARMEQDFTSA